MMNPWLAVSCGKSWSCSRTLRLPVKPITGERALEEIAALRPDVVFLDLQMPQMADSK